MTTNRARTTHLPAVIASERQSTAQFTPGSAAVLVLSQADVLRNAAGRLTRVGVKVPILMAMSEFSLADARNRLSELVAEVEKTHARVTMTKHGHPAAVLISPDDLASLEETLEILSTPGALDEIREAEAEIARGETFDEATIRGDLAARSRRVDVA